MHRAAPAARHEFEEHTGEVQVLLEAPTLQELFVEAGRALAGLMATEPPASVRPPGERIALQAPDREALLVDWLNELIFLSETRKQVFTELSIEELSDTSLRAVVRGGEPPALRTPVKAATFHGLRIAGGPGAYSARLVLDV